MNLNAVAEAVGASFRFNDDQVLDPENNVEPDFIPLTDEFNSAFPYFEDRPGLGVELDSSKTYTVDAVEVTDSDTIDVRFDNGTEDTVRMLGIDTPETSSEFERIQEWEGIESADYLLEQGEVATEYRGSDSPTRLSKSALMRTGRFGGTSAACLPTSLSMERSTISRPSPTGTPGCTIRGSRATTPFSNPTLMPVRRDRAFGFRANRTAPRRSTMTQSRNCSSRKRRVSPR
jgi:hypothetical protein